MAGFSARAASTLPIVPYADAGPLYGIVCPILISVSDAPGSYFFWASDGRDVAASTQAAIVEVLVKKSLTALQETGLQRIVVAGGVGANRQLREQLDAACAKRRVRVHYPELHLCTDNGAMIALAAAMRLQSGQQQANRDYAFDVKPRWPLNAIG